MNTNTGEVMTQEKLEALPSHRRARWVGVTQPIDPSNLSEKNRAQLAATGRTKISRNSPCPCGSRKRFKRCCMTTP